MKEQRGQKAHGEAKQDHVPVDVLSDMYLDNPCMHDIFQRYSHIHVAVLVDLPVDITNSSNDAATFALALAPPFLKYICTKTLPNFF